MRRKTLYNCVFLFIGLLLFLPSFSIASPDLWTWRYPVPQGNALFEVTYSESKGVYIAVGDKGSILTSSDGTNWTLAISPTNNLLSGVTYDGSDTFVAVGNNGAVLTSSDSTNWISRTSGDDTYSL